MKNLRQFHLYLGCLFAPLIIYFAISGAWQVFRFNDVPESGGTALQSLLHAASAPHTHSTLPGANPKQHQSQGFNWIAVMMGVGMAVTSILGIVIALQSARSRRWAAVCLVGGLLVPVLFLFFAAH